MLAENRVQLGRLEHETGADEFLDLRLDIEQPADGACEPRGAFCLGAKKPGKLKLRRIRNAVEVLVRLGANSDRRADIGDEAVSVGAIMLRDRPGIRPGAKEQLNKAMIENVEKARERVVLCEQVVIGLLGGRQRQRALRPEQAEKFHENLSAACRHVPRPRAQCSRRENPCTGPGRAERTRRAAPHCRQSAAGP